MGERRFPFEALAMWVAGVLQAVDVPSEHAATAAGVLVRSDARGSTGHGLSRLKSYVDKIEAGEVEPRPDIRHGFRDGVLHVDGDGGLGQVVATHAFEEAVKAARRTPVVAGVVRESGHLGAIGLFTLAAAEAGMAALFTQSAPPTMALPGAERAAIGNSPISFACPVPGADPFVLDMSTSLVSRGRVLLAAREGRPIPEGWALDRDGRPTSDAAEAIAGAMLPLAGHKGIGLAMMIECLAGSLAGAPPVEPPADGAFSAGLGRRSGFLLVIDPVRFAGRQAYEAHMAAWMRYYLATGGPDARIPGRRAAETERERRRTGVPLAPPLVDELTALGERTGVPFGITPLPD